MTSPETPSPAPQRSPFIAGDGSWKASLPFATVLGIFLATLVGLFAWFDNRFASGLDGVEQRLTAQIVEVKTDLTNRIDGVEKRLTNRIDQVETGLNARIDRVEQRLSDKIDRVEKELGGQIGGVKADLAASEAKREAADARQSAAMERLADGIAENRANHRELAGFVRAHHPGAPQPEAPPSQ